MSTCYHLEVTNQNCEDKYCPSTAKCKIHPEYGEFLTIGNCESVKTGCRDYDTFKQLDRYS